MEGCTRWLLILGSRREKDQHRGPLQFRLLKQPLPKNAAGAFRCALRRPAGTTLRGDVVFTPCFWSSASAAISVRLQPKRAKPAPRFPVLYQSVYGQPREYYNQSMGLP